MSPWMHWRFLCLCEVWDLWPLQTHSLGSAPPAPPALLPTLPASSWNPSSQKRAGITLQRWSCPVLSCRICTAGGETELPQGCLWTHKPTSISPNPDPQPQILIPIPISHTTACAHSPAWQRGEDSLLHTLDFLVSSITSSEQNKQILNFTAKALLPSWLALSLHVGLAWPSIKTPATNSEVFKNPPKHPLLPLFSTKSPWNKSVFKRMKTTRGVASTRERRALNKELNIWALLSTP